MEKLSSKLYPAGVPVTKWFFVITVSKKRFLSQEKFLTVFCEKSEKI